jgi:hypothetical protein
MPQGPRFVLLDAAGDYHQVRSLDVPVHLWDHPDRLERGVHPYHGQHGDVDLRAARAGMVRQGAPAATAPFLTEPFLTTPPRNVTRGMSLVRVSAVSMLGIRAGSMTPLSDADLPRRCSDERARLGFWRTARPRAGTHGPASWRGRGPGLGKGSSLKALSL